MKLLIITAISAFDKDIKQMLKQADVKTFTYKEVKGYKDISEEAIESNWFASEVNETESILFYAFVKIGNVDRVFDLVSDFNEKQKTLSKIHVAVLNIERSNNQ
jgi:nitrogen regulatory protein PII